MSTQAPGGALGIGIVGCGMIGQIHADGLAKLAADGEIRAVAAADPSEAACAAVDRNAGGFARLHAEGAAVVDDAEVEAVMVTTPTVAHRDLVHAVVAAGKPLFCEKPLAPTFDVVRELCDAGDGVGDRRPGGLPLPLPSDLVPLRRARASRASSGAPMGYTMRDDQYWPTGDVVPGHSSWRSDRAQAGGGALLEHSIHSADIVCRGYSDRPHRCSRTARSVFGYDVEDTAALTIEHADGVVGSLVTIFNGVRGREERRFEAFFERGAVEITTDFVVGAPEDSFLVQRPDEPAERVDLASLRDAHFDALGLDAARLPLLHVPVRPGVGARGRVRTGGRPRLRRRARGPRPGRSGLPLGHRPHTRRPRRRPLDRSPHVTNPDGPVPAVPAAPAPLRNRVTEVLGVDYPIVQAPMGYIARAQLASAVSNAGALGIVETSSGRLDEVRDEIAKMSDLTDKPFGVNIAQLFVHDPAIVDFVHGQGVRFVTTSAGRPVRLHRRRCTRPASPSSTSCPALRAALEGGRARGSTGSSRRAARVADSRRVATSRRWCCCRSSARRSSVPVIAAGGHLRRPLDGRRVRARRGGRADGDADGLGRGVAGPRQLQDSSSSTPPETGTVFLNRWHKPSFRVLATPFSENLEQSDERVGIGSLDRLLDLYFEGNLEAAFAFGGQVAGRIDGVRPVAEVVDETISEFYDTIATLAAGGAHPYPST